MKCFLLLCTLALHCTLHTYAQGIGINQANAAPHPSALLDVSSTTQGFLPPRMSTQERINIKNPADGLLVFDTQTSTLWCYSGTWQELPAAPNPGFTLPYSGSLSSVAPIFTIHNISAGLTGPSIVGRHLTGSGVTGLIASIWGDHTNNTGVAGTSNTGSGVYGYSEAGDGVYGLAKAINKGGVMGQHLANGPSVLGLTNTGGIGIYGRCLSDNGVAGWFRSESTANNKNTLNVQQFGLGRAAEFFATANANTTETIKATGGSNSSAAIMGVLSSQQATSTALYGENFYNGMGLYAASKLGQAARFENTDNTNTKHVVHMANVGSGSNLYLTNTNVAGAAPMLQAVNAGNAHFFIFKNTQGDTKASLNAAGNFVTGGTVTVKDSKGIVRNTTATQLRMEMFTASFTPAGGVSEVIAPGTFREVLITFGTSFSSAPAVYIANIISDGNMSYMTTSVINVTTTGCKILIRNTNANNITLYNTQWRMVAVGAE
ncbi:MAG TPA: hypothetical protein PKD90_08660 [Phnomibacter sp.]|nr:hypothetical protein [Phnomibacter sp.]